MVTWENYEEYMMLDADGELNSAGKEALLAFIAANPALEAELAAWQSLKLAPDTTIAFTGKDALLKKEAKRIVLGWNIRTTAAAAAIILILFSIPLIWRSRLPEPIAGELPTPGMIDAASPARSPEPATSAAVLQPKVIRMTRIAAHHRLSQPPVQDTLTVPDGLVSNPSGTLPVTAEGAPVLPAVELAGHVGPQDVPLPRHESAVPEIHFAEANQQALKMLKRGLDERASQISNAAKAIRETAFSVRIGNKNHYLNF